MKQRQNKKQKVQAKRVAGVEQYLARIKVRATALWNSQLSVDRFYNRAAKNKSTFGAITNSFQTASNYLRDIWIKAGFDNADPLSNGFPLEDQLPELEAMMGSLTKAESTLATGFSHLNGLLNGGLRRGDLTLLYSVTTRPRSKLININGKEYYALDLPKPAQTIANLKSAVASMTGAVVVLEDSDVYLPVSEQMNLQSLGRLKLAMEMDVNPDDYAKTIGEVIAINSSSTSIETKGMPAPTQDFDELDTGNGILQRRKITPENRSDTEGWSMAVVDGKPTGWLIRVKPGSAPSPDVIVASYTDEKGISRDLRDLDLEELYHNKHHRGTDDNQQ